MCFRVTDVGVQYLTKGCSANELQELNVSHCSHITDISVMRIAQRYTQLRLWLYDSFFHENLPRTEPKYYHKAASVCCFSNLLGCANFSISIWVTARGWRTRLWSGWVEALSARSTSAAATSRIKYYYHVCSCFHAFLKIWISGIWRTASNLGICIFRDWPLLREFLWGNWLLPSASQSQTLELRCIFIWNFSQVFSVQVFFLSHCFVTLTTDGNYICIQTFSWTNGFTKWNPSLYPQLFQWIFCFQQTNTIEEMISNFLHV